MEDGKGSFFWVEEQNDQTPRPLKHRRKAKTKKVEFAGWGSKSLIEFLQSIGKDTGKQISQYDVSKIINHYVDTFNLLNPMKKKRVVCDERLHSLFGKKSFLRNKIHELLKPHFAVDDDSSEDDGLYHSEEYDDVSINYKKQKVTNSEKTSLYQKIKAPDTLLSCYAAIIPENIKLLYLKRSLIQELVKNPESFQGKLLGSYIRIKSDPNDFSQKNSHQLHPVTGVKSVPVNGGVCEEILIQVPNTIKDIPVCMLSDDDFSKEECEDLCQRVKDGLLKRPTVVEFEQKARILHEDITKHWLPRELVHLQNLIDRANEKGWRKELFEYLERKKVLQTPSEQSKLLTEVPKVTADRLEPEATPQEQVDDIKQSNGSPISFHGDVSPPVNDSVIDKELPSPHSDAAEDEVLVLDKDDKNNAEPKENAGSGEQSTSFQWVEAEQIPKTKSSDQALHLINVPTVIELSDQIPKTKSLDQALHSINVPTVIELSDDEEKSHEQENEEKTHEQEDELEFTRKKWFYHDPQGQIQGPVSRFELKRWSDAGYFTPDFKVWKEGQTPNHAILLMDMLSSK